MFSKIKTIPSTKNYSAQIDKLKKAIKNCDAIIIGAGAGLSAAAGFTYSGERFKKYFSDFKEKYGFNDMYCGDYGLFQCSEPCCQKTFDNEKIIKEMYEKQKDLKIPTELIPKCPYCGKTLTTNLRCDDKFVQDNGWYKASERYSDFIRRHKNLKTLYLEIGVGYNTPTIIKYPFWQMTFQNPNSTYACINKTDAVIPIEVERQSICIKEDISKVINLMHN